MKKEELKIFEDYCRSYAKRFVDCVCANTEEKWLHTFSRNRWWRCQMELEEKKNIIIKNTDIKAYHTYEEIMVDTLKKKIEEDKVIANKKAREKAKKSKEDKMKGKKK